MSPALPGPTTHTGSGDDTIAGMAGIDVINSGSGHDIIVENAVVGTSASGRSKCAAAGNDATGVFGSSASDTFGSGTERFHYNTATHTLQWQVRGRYSLHNTTL